MLCQDGHVAVVNEIELPGIGVRYEFVTEGGARVGVVHHRTGERRRVAAGSDAEVASVRARR
jgi:TrkA domain protein